MTRRASVFGGGIERLDSTYDAHEDNTRIIHLDRSRGFGYDLVFNLRFPGQYYDQETGLHYNWHRYYDPETGRYISADPIEQRSGPNLYAYAFNNPLLWIDPLGLYSEVIFWSGAGSEGSSFGHVSVDINGTSYSFGPGGNTVEPTGDYLERNSFRSGTGIELGLTPEQEAALADQLGGDQGDYSTLTNNCGDPVESGLEGLGFDLGTNVTPSSLFDSVVGSDAGIATHAHPASGPDATGPVAPWSPQF